MKYPMDDSRTYRSESGFALIEVIVAAAVLAIVALAVLSGIDAASSTSAREKARAVAASLAEQDQERMRGMTYEQVNEKPNVKQQDPINVDGTTYKIESEVNLVTDDIGGTPECGDEGTQVTYVHITSTVTTPDTGTIGTKIRPVKVDSLIPPTQKWAEGHGTLGVKVVDRSATKGVRNLSVSATSPGYTPPNETTDQNGCAVFKDVPVGTYTITLNSLGYLDRDGEPALAGHRQRRGQEGRLQHDVLRRRRRGDGERAHPHARQDMGECRSHTAAAVAGAQRDDDERRQGRLREDLHAGFAADERHREPAVPVRRELLHLLHRCVSLPVTRQGDQHEQLDAAVPELLQFDRRGEPRRGRVARPVRRSPAGVRPSAPVQHPRRLHSKRSDLQRRRTCASTPRCRSPPATRPTPAPRPSTSSTRARGIRPSSVPAPPATAVATTTGSARSRPRTTPGCPSAPTSSACATTTSTAVWS